jgi:predicted amidohydrolase
VTSLTKKARSSLLPIPAKSAKIIRKMRSFVFLATLSIASGLKAAVVQHVGVNSTAEPTEVIKGNLAKYSNATAIASAQGAEIVVFPEFGLGLPADSCENPQAVTPFCETVPYLVGQSPCESNGALDTPIQYSVSCLAQQHGLYVAVNTCEATVEGNYNTEIVYEPLTGNMVAKYRKVNPWYTKCFLKPSQPDLVYFNFTENGKPTQRQLGLMTCFDILFPTPGPVLASPPYNIKTFVYSASIPMIGGDVQALWSGAHNAVILGSNLATGQSGVWRNGTRLTPVPPSQGDAVLVADV